MNVNVEEQQYIIFNIKDVKYGIAIENVIEVIKLLPITPLPKTPDFIKGVVNLRGKVVPIIDLRERFGYNDIELTDNARIIITLIEANKEIGLIVDSVSEVLTLSEKLIEPPMSITGSLKTDYILGIAKLEESLILLVNIEKILTSEEKNLLHSEV